LVLRLSFFVPGDGIDQVFAANAARPPSAGGKNLLIDTDSDTDGEEGQI